MPGAEFPRLGSEGLEFRIHAPGAHQVKLQLPGDSLGSGSVPFSPEPDGFWHAVISDPAVGFHYYQVEIDALTTNDPGSRTYSGYGRSVSGVEVPDPLEPFELRDVPHGELRSLWFRSTVTRSWRELWVWTPPGYDDDIDRHYPVLYLQHGSGEDETSWSRQGRAGIIMDNLLADGAARPTLVVMGSGYAAAPPSTPLSAVDSAMIIDGLQQLLADDVIATVDRQYRTITDRTHRALAGLSMGGRQALAIGLRRPDLFGWLGGLSPAIWQRGTTDAVWSVEPTWIEDAVRAAGGVRPQQVFLSAGTLEERFVTAVDELAGSLAAAGIDHKSYLSPGTAHEWTTWRRSLTELAPRLFR
ncbi:alpha/beta hydrolase-fold protein [Microlunatus endophyticus]|nr:alpha/beta hydrolase-fold protein [Microlunatus endophyticus]